MHSDVLEMDILGICNSWRPQ